MDSGLELGCNSGKAGPGGLCLSSSMAGGTCKKRGDNKASRCFLLLLAAQKADDPGDLNKKDVGALPRWLLLVVAVVFEEDACCDCCCDFRLGVRGDMGDDDALSLCVNGRGVDGADRLGRLPFIPDPIRRMARDKR